MSWPLKNNENINNAIVVDVSSFYQYWRGGGEEGKFLTLYKWWNGFQNDSNIIRKIIRQDLWSHESL